MHVVVTDLTTISLYLGLVLAVPGGWGGAVLTCGGVVGEADPG